MASTTGDAGESAPASGDNTDETGDGTASTDMAEDAGSVPEADMATEPDVSKDDAGNAAANGNGSSGLSDAGTAKDSGAASTNQSVTVKPLIETQIETCEEDACNDGVACTVDSCDAETGTCSHDASDCECGEDNDCERPEGAWACLNYTCDPRARECVEDASDCECETTEDCGVPDVCEAFTCTEGECDAEVTEGEPCDDGIECTSTDTCQSDGACSGDASGCVSGPPAGYLCDASTYGDSTCHCGCGSVDIDCGGPSAAMCEVCTADGSCAESCGEITRQNNASCKSIPDDWSCGPAAFSDGICDCGCGATDADCAGDGADVCARCTRAGSCANGCNEIDRSDNSQCADAAWTCPDSYYGDGNFCDCGCGIVDSDCVGADVFSCDYCDAEGACSNDCTDIQADDNSLCRGVPGSWTCDHGLFGDGENCDCACGALDIDCRSNSPAECDSCDAEGSCAGSCEKVHPETSAICELPSGWICPEIYYADGECDCGCGVIDVDCVSSDFDACLYSWCEDSDVSAADNAKCE